MATGPENYREAERLLAMGNTQVAEAQVHATLAAAAAQIELALSMQADNGVSVEWIKAVTT